MEKNQMNHYVKKTISIIIFHLREAEKLKYLDIIEIMKFRLVET